MDTIYSIELSDIIDEKEFVSIINKKYNGNHFRMYFALWRKEFSSSFDFYCSLPVLMDEKITKHLEMNLFPESSSKLTSVQINHIQNKKLE